MARAERARRRRGERGSSDLSKATVRNLTFWGESNGEPLQGFEQSSAMKLSKEASMEAGRPVRRLLKSR